MRELAIAYPTSKWNLLKTYDPGYETYSEYYLYALFCTIETVRGVQPGPYIYYERLLGESRPFRVERDCALLERLLREKASRPYLGHVVECLSSSIKASLIRYSPPPSSSSICLLPTE